MTKIYGNYIPCTTTPISCGCDYVYCEHTTEVFKKYGYPPYAPSSNIVQLITILMDYQEASLEKLCELELPLKPLVQAIGFKCCYYESSPEDCINICGGSYTPHTFTEIVEVDCITNCVEPEYDDTFLVNVLSMSEYLSYPSRENIQAICDIFGWELVYTSDYINILIGTDDPNLYKPVIDLIPVPIGEEIRILTVC